MFGLFFLLTWWCLGFALLTVCHLTWSSLEKLLASWVIGLIIGGWWYFGWVAAVGYGWGLPIATTTGLTIAGTVLLRKRVKWSDLTTTWWPPTSSSGNKYSYLVFAIATALLLGWFFWTRMLWVGPDGWYSGGGSWADLAMHSSFIHYFASQSSLALRSPIYAQEPTTYPFMVNFATALLIKGGWSIQAALIATGLPMAWISLQLLYWLLFRWYKHSLAAWMGVVVWCCNGGNGWWLAWKDWQKSGVSLLAFLRHLPEDYSIIRDLNLQWSNVVTTHILPQRGFAATLPVILLCLLLWWSVDQATLAHKHASQTRKWLLLSALLVGSLPWWYVHGFLVALGLFAGLSAWWLWHKQLSWRWIATSWSLVIMCAAPQLLWQFTQSSGNNTPYLHLGWLAPRHGFWQFWWQNLGLALPVWAGGTIWLWWQRQLAPFIKIVVSLLTLCFVLCNIVIFQAYDWNNMKFMLLAYLAVAIIVAAAITNWWHDHQKTLITNTLKKVVLSIAVVGLCLSGVLSLVKESQSNFVLVSNHDLQMARAVARSTPAESIFLTGNQHNHPIPMVAGRPTLMGYPGWLWTHGLSYQKLEQDIKHMYAGATDAPQLLALYHVDYVAIGPWEKSQFLVNQAFFDQHFPVKIESNGTTIYQINETTNN